MPQYRRLGVPITHRSYLFKSGGCQSTPWVTSYGEIMENLLNLRLSISIRWCISQTPNQNCRSVGLAYRILMKRCLSASSRPSFLWWSSWLLPPAFPWRILLQSCFADPLFSSAPNLQQSQKGVRSRRPLLWNQMMIRLPLLQPGSRAQIMSLYLICWKYSSPEGRNSRALRRLRILVTFVELARVQLFQTIIALIFVQWILHRQKKLKQNSQGGSDIAGHLQDSQSAKIW